MLVSSNHLAIVPDDGAAVDFVITNQFAATHEGTCREQSLGPTTIICGPADPARLPLHCIALPENAGAEMVRTVVALAAQTRALRRSLAEARDELARWRSAALTDPLTGLLSRRGWDERLATSPPGAATAFWTVAIVDLDDFKRVNDTGGLAQGDALLTAVGMALGKTAAANDIVARWGGDEFAIALTAANRHDAAERFESYRRAIGGEIPLSPHLRPLTASVGWAWRPATEGASVAELFAEAEAALRTAKKRGRNQIYPAR